MCRQIESYLYFLSISQPGWEFFLSFFFLRNFRVISMAVLLASPANGFLAHYRSSGNNCGMTELWNIILSLFRGGAHPWPPCQALASYSLAHISGRGRWRLPGCNSAPIGEAQWIFEVSVKAVRGSWFLCLLDIPLGLPLTSLAAEICKWSLSDRR